MPYTVEVRRIGADLAASMAEMRKWLDDNRITSTEFDHSTGGPGIVFRLVFRAERDALAFAEAFRGILNDGREPRWILPLGKSSGRGSRRNRHPDREREAQERSILERYAWRVGWEGDNR